LDNLLGKLLTHEIRLKDDKEEAQTQRGVAFKTTNEELHSSNDESSESDKDSIAIITRGLKPMLRQRDLIPSSSTKRDLYQRDMRKFQKVPELLTMKMNLILVLGLVVACQGMW